MLGEIITRLETPIQNTALSLTTFDVFYFFNDKTFFLDDESNIKNDIKNENKTNDENVDNNKIENNKSKNKIIEKNIKSDRIRLFADENGNVIFKKNVDANFFENKNNNNINNNVNGIHKNENLDFIKNNIIDENTGLFYCILFLLLLLVLLLLLLILLLILDIILFVIVYYLLLCA
jgi:hypothetical protein